MSQLKQVYIVTAVVAVRFYNVKSFNNLPISLHKAYHELYVGLWVANAMGEFIQVCEEYSDNGKSMKIDDLNLGFS